MTSPAQRIHDSHQQAQNLPHRPGPVDPRDATRMAATILLTKSQLPDPALFATWAGHTQATTALDAATRAYADGDHTRSAAWLQHTQIVLDANGIRADHPAWLIIDKIVAAIAPGSTVAAGASTERPVGAGAIDGPLIAGADLASPDLLAQPAVAGSHRASVDAASAVPGERQPQLGTIGLFVLIERYELALIAQQTLDRTRQPELRASIDTYIGDHHLHETPLSVELCLRDWAGSQAPGLLEAWQRSIVAAGDYNAGAEQLRTIDAARRWTPALNDLSPALTVPHELPALAASLRRAETAGYDLANRLPALAHQAPLPPRHTGRELHFRLLIDCPAALPDPPPRPDRLQPQLPDRMPGAALSMGPFDTLARQRSAHHRPGPRLASAPAPQLAPVSRTR
jgi:hypothetical protein